MASRLAGLRNFLFRTAVVRLTRLYYARVWGMDIGEGVHISRSAKLDLSNPEGIHIGDYTCVAFDAAILTHDFVNNVHLPVHIGSHCLIGARAVVMPGVTIGDHCIIGTSAVVMRNVPARSLVIGNPGRVMETGIDTGKWGARIRSAAAAPSDPTAPAELPAAAA